MFERFTALARRTIVHAQEEARQLDHNYIGTEHILLGLLAEPGSVGGSVLASFGITSEIGREEVVRRVGRGKKAPSGHIPFTPRAKKTLELSLREALQLGHNYIGTEHILLGLIREGDGVAVKILRDRTDLAQLRLAVIESIPESSAAETAEGDETNAVLRWLRSRLSRHVPSTPFRPDSAAGTTGYPGRGTPAVEAVLRQAARLAGPRPVGSHHLLLAALDDQDSAASWALASLGVDLDELREKLRTARLAGTSDEQPEQAGRRQMAIEVSDEMVHIVLTDPVIVEAGKEALRAVNVRVAQAAAMTEVSGTSEPTGASGASGAAADAGEGSASPANVIRGDLPAAAGLANVWLELRKTLATIVDPAPPAGKPVRVAVGPPASSPLPADPAEPGEASADDEAEAGQ
jgi:ATP-dependent Clp protease ATP-binding subunit ClpA